MKLQQHAVTHFSLDPLPFNFNFTEANTGTPILAIPQTLLKINRCLSVVNIQTIKGVYYLNENDWELAVELNKYQHKLRFSNDTLNQIVPDRAIYLRISQINVQIYQQWLELQFKEFFDRNISNDDD